MHPVMIQISMRCYAKSQCCRAQSHIMEIGSNKIFLMIFGTLNKSRATHRRLCVAEPNPLCGSRNVSRRYATLLLFGGLNFVPNHACLL